MKKIETAKDINNIKELYFNKKHTLKQIANFYGVCPNTIKKILLDNFKEDYLRESKRNYKNLGINKSFFDTIDTEEKVYILGFFLADGNMYYKDSSYKIRFCIAEQDIQLLNPFKQILNLDSKIQIRKRKDRENSQRECTLSWTSESHYKALNKYGMDESKTYTAGFPVEKINKNVIHHFIRGIFDGDGSISIKKNRHKQVSIVGTYDTINGIRNYLVSELNIYPVKILSRKKKIEIFQIMWGSKSDIEKIYNYLYHDATIFLSRKKEKFLS